MLQKFLSPLVVGQINAENTSKTCAQGPAAPFHDSALEHDFRFEEKLPAILFTTALITKFMR